MSGKFFGVCSRLLWRWLSNQKMLMVIDEEIYQSRAVIPVNLDVLSFIRYNDEAQQE